MIQLSVMMVLLLLVLIVVFALLVRTSKKSLVAVSFGAALLLGVTTVMLFELVNGPHPECGINESVGPCDYLGRVAHGLAFVPLLLTLYWTAILSVYHLLRRGSVKRPSRT